MDKRDFVVIKLRIVRKDETKTLLDSIKALSEVFPPGLAFEVISVAFDQLED